MFVWEANAKLQKQMAAMQHQLDQKTPASTPVVTPRPTRPPPSPASHPRRKALRKPANEEPVEPEGGDEGSGPGSDQEPSLAAKNNRLRRLCEKKPSGKINVPQHIHDAWAAGGHSREQLLEALEEANWNKDMVSMHGCSFVKIGYPPSILIVQGLALGPVRQKGHQVL